MGSRERRIHAAYQFFLYTLFGSLIMLSGLIFIYFHIGSTDLLFWVKVLLVNTVRLYFGLLFLCHLLLRYRCFLYIFASRSTCGGANSGIGFISRSFIKVGHVRFLRFSIPLFPYGTQFFLPLIYTMSLIAIIYSSLLQ